ncbi:MAG TPA: hypothetical protein VF618_22190 [Thermoanaerobaculia bacterium]
MYKVMVGGLVFFNVGTANAPFALIPDGRTNPGAEPPIYASLFIEPHQYATDDWWPEERLDRQVTVVNNEGRRVAVPIKEFRIPQFVELTFPVAKPGQVDVVNFDTTLPSLKQIDPGFVLDLGTADKLARVPIRGGRLEVFGVRDVATVQWTITDHSGPIRILARTQNNDIRSITLHDDRGLAEIVLTNIPDIIPGQGQQPGNATVVANAAATGLGGHFQLYGKLNVGRDASKLTAPSDRPKLARLAFNHSFFRFIESRDEFPDPQCVPTRG